MTQSNAEFNPNYEVIEKSFNKDAAHYVKENVEKIRNYLMFNDETGQVIALQSGEFTHNIIGMTLQGIAQKTDNATAQSILDGFNLQTLGW